MAAPTAPRTPRRSAAELASARSHISLAVGARPQALEETAGREALRSALASDVWTISDTDAYAAELEAELNRS